MVVELVVLWRTDARFVYHSTRTADFKHVRCPTNGAKHRVRCLRADVERLPAFQANLVVSIKRCPVLWATAATRKAVSNVRIQSALAGELVRLIDCYRRYHSIIVP